MFTDTLVPGIDFPLSEPLAYIGSWGVTEDSLDALQALRQAWGDVELARDLMYNGLSTHDVQILFGYMGGM